MCRTFEMTHVDSCKQATQTERYIQFMSNKIIKKIRTENYRDIANPGVAPLR